MATQRFGILTDSEIEAIVGLPEVDAARAALTSSGKVDLQVRLPATVTARLCESLGLQMNEESPVHLRWIRGDTAAHKDIGAHAFERTHLMYLTDSPGLLQVAGVPYPIRRGAAYSFEEGVGHETIETGDEPRLLLGPMSERGFAVGAGPGGIIYFQTQAEALAGMPVIDIINSFTVETVNGISSWKVALTLPPDFLPFDPNAIYSTGTTLTSLAGVYYHVYPAPADNGKTSCCAGILRQKGLDNTTRTELISGVVQNTQAKRNVRSYEEYYKRLRARSGGA